MLLHARTNEEYPTVYDVLTLEDVEAMKRDEGWEKSFDWRCYFQGAPDVEVYKLMVRGGSDRIEGVVAIQLMTDHVFVLLAESAPHNRGERREFFRVGGHLFAIACQRSVEQGYDGFTALDAKTGLIAYYQMEYGMIAYGQRMILDDVAAKDLIRVYLT
ncbi:MAG TPA: hypothetical protein VFV52_08875 [Bacilli bacterium]|nr:hypothetical protein [Bacilli bacterium]